jgi:PAS domain-containing protein
LTWADAVHPGDVERIKLGMATESMPVRGGAELEFRIVRPDGEQRWISVRTYPVTHERQMLALRESLPI